jgi:hypothetical protein
MPEYITASRRQHQRRENSAGIASAACAVFLAAVDAASVALDAAAMIDIDEVGQLRGEGSRFAWSLANPSTAPITTPAAIPAASLFPHPLDSSIATQLYINP